MGNFNSERQLKVVAHDKKVQPLINIAGSDSENSDDMYLDHISKQAKLNDEKLVSDLPDTMHDAKHNNVKKQTVEEMLNEIRVKQGKPTDPPQLPVRQSRGSWHDKRGKAK